MATVKRRSTVPYYAAAGTWVIYALLFPLYRVPHFIFIAVVSAVVYFIMNAVCGTVEVTVPDPPKKEESTGNPELDKMIKDGNLAISEMKRLNTSIKDEKISADIDADILLIDFVRDHGCYSVKRGCETSNCGLCTVFLDEKPVLSCSVLAARADGRTVTTLEGLQEEAKEFGAFIADQGAEQCGFCNPGFIMNALALFRENEYPEEEEIREYLAGNLCRCSGYEGQLRAIRKYLAVKGGEQA